MSPPIAHTRIFVALTLEEAAAVARLQPGADVGAIAALAKIRTALEGATQPPASSPPVPRSKDYWEPPPPLTLRIPVNPPRAVTRRRMAKATVPANASAPSPKPPALDDDYVPYRDEAGGIYT